MTVLTYLDDIFVVGPGNQDDYLLGELRSIKLKICDHKCEIDFPSLNIVNCFSIPVASSKVDLHSWCSCWK